MEKPWSQRLSVLELSTMRWSFEDDVVRYRDHGYRAIGIWREKLADFGETKGRELLDELGMSVSSLHWAGGFTGFEGRSHTESLCDALDAVHTAAELQADCLVILAGSRAGHTRSHVRRLLVSALKEVAQAASVLGVELALEPMHSGCARDFSFLSAITWHRILGSFKGSQKLSHTSDSCSAVIPRRPLAVRRTDVCLVMDAFRSLLSFKPLKRVVTKVTTKSSLSGRMSRIMITTNSLSPRTRPF
jgi:hypothetical protein